MELLIALLSIFIAMIIIWKVCDGFETASQYLGRNLSEGVRGATINAIGSSMPELLSTSIALLLYYNKDGFAFGIGTTAGSAIFNSAIIPALVIFAVVMIMSIGKIEVSRKVILRDGIALLIAEAVLIWMLSSNVLDWKHGLGLMALYVAYIVYMFSTMKKNGEAEDDDDDTPEKCWGMTVNSDAKAWFILIFAIVFIAAACHILVESCYKIGEILDIRVYFVSVILAAAATSVPDTILSVKDALSGDYDDSVSNALGSNIFDICMCLGLPLFFFSLFTGQNITIASNDTNSVWELRILLFVCTCAVFLTMLLGKRMGMGKCIILLGIYGAFLGRILYSSGVF